MTDLSVVVISLSVIVLCWAVVRLNQKLNDTLSKQLSDNTIDSMHERPSENPVQVAAGADSEPAPRG